MKRSNNIFLIGPMGAGKSTIGKYLSKELKLEFIDTDHEIEKRAGADISWIYDVEGESGFRKREEAIVDECTQKHGIVLATGGGVITSEANRNHLAARGVVIYLKATVEEQVERTKKDRRRPLLQQKGKDKEQVLSGLMDERADIYSELADLVITTDSGSVRSVANEVIRALEQEHLC